MSPDERSSFLSLGSSVECSALGDLKLNLTSDRYKPQINLSQSTTSKSTHPEWFNPLTNSSPQKSSTIISRGRSVQQSKTTLPLSPPLSLYGSTPSSSRSISDDLTVEFEEISNGLADLARQTAVKLKRASLECRDGDLIRECNILVGRLPDTEKKYTHQFDVEESNFHIHTSSSNGSCERLHAGGSGIENARANRTWRGGIESDPLFSPTYPPQQRILSSGRKEKENGKQTTGTQTNYEMRKEDIQSRGTMVDDDVNDRRKIRKKKERVYIVEDRSSSPSPERVRVPPRFRKDTVRREPERREVENERVLHGARLDNEFDVSLPSFLSIPSRRIRFEPIDFSKMTTSLPTRFGYNEKRERNSSPRKEKEVIERRARADKTRMELIKEDKEKRVVNWYPPLCDIDELRGRKKNIRARMATLGGDEMKKRIGDEKKVVRRATSVGMNGVRKRGESHGGIKRAAFVASSQVDGVSHSLVANRQQLLNLIKCHLPLIHQRVKEYLEGTRAAREGDIMSGLKKYLEEELRRIEKEEDDKFSVYDRMEDGEKKEDLGREIHRLDVMNTETDYLIRELNLISPIKSSSLVNQLRCIHSHLLKCAPLRSEE